MRQLCIEHPSIKGGEITANFSKYMASEGWFNLASINGTSDGQSESWNFNPSNRNDIQVLGGFDVGAINDQLSFYFYANIVDSLDDLNIQTVGDDVKITFVDPALAGEIWILDVAPTFDAAVNILLPDIVI